MIYEKEKRYIIPFDDAPSARAEMPEISVDARRGNYAEVETGFSEEMAVREAKRCLACRRCLGCALCWAECKPEAIDFGIPDEELELVFDQVILTKGQDNAFEPFDSQLGYGSYPNVITDLQFERMLSPTGPTKGRVLSPLDGEIPSRLAIVQGYTKEDEGHLFSSLVLGVNESILALDKTENLEVLLISPICQSFQEKYLAEAEEISGLQVIPGLPVSVAKGQDTGDLTLDYLLNGEQRKETFGLIVILSKQKVSPGLESLSKKLEQEIV